MKILSRFLSCTMLLTCFTATVCFAQKEKITGRWQPVRMITEYFPGGIDVDWLEKKLMKR